MRLFWMTVVFIVFPNPTYRGYNEDADIEKLLLSQN